MERCISDMLKAVGRGKILLEEQVRAYDMLDRLLDTGETGNTDNFRIAYEKVKSDLPGIYDEEALVNELEKSLDSLRRALEEIRFEAAAAASLHEFAKEVFEIWQTSGIFARKRALKELRKRAGFRLESHRIGNYVAKTFDLMNEGQARYAKAQQALFKADVRYKIKPDIYRKIYEALQ